MSFLSQRAKKNRRTGHGQYLQELSGGHNTWVRSNYQAKCFILCLTATLAIHLLLPDSSPFQFYNGDARKFYQHFDFMSLSPPDPGRVCAQNPYITALNSSIADVVAKMDSWSVEEHLAKIPQNPDNLQHTHARFFPFEPFAHCQSDKLSCVGGPCKSDLSKIACGLGGALEKVQTAENEPKLKSSAPNNNNRQEQEEAPPRCIVYSLGGNNEWDFERDLLRRTPCEIHTFDCTGRVTRFRKPKNPRIHFHHVCLGTQHEDGAKKCARKSKCGETWTLLEMQQKLGHSRIDLLKMDIEGFEWPIFESWPLLSDTAASEGMLLPMQVLVEIHYNTPFSELRPSNDVTNGEMKKATDIVHLQSRFLKMGYVVVARDDNALCMHCSELTLVRIRCPGGGAYATGALASLVHAA